MTPFNPRAFRFRGIDPLNTEHRSTSLNRTLNSGRTGAVFPRKTKKPTEQSAERRLNIVFSRGPRFRVPLNTLETSETLSRRGRRLDERDRRAAF